MGGGGGGGGAGRGAPWPAGEWAKPPARVAAASRSGKSPHSPAEPSPSCSITMVGGAPAPPASRYSSLASPMVRKPVGERGVMPSLLPSSIHLAKLEALDLSGRGFRQAVDHFDPARIFPRSDRGLHVLLERRVELLARLAVLQHHERLRLEQSVRVGGRDDRRLQDRGMADQRALDLEGRDPDTRHLEHVVGAAAVGVAPFAVADELVAGARPGAAERASALLA